MKRLFVRPVLVLFLLLSVYVSLSGPQASAWSGDARWMSGPPELRVSGDAVTVDDTAAAATRCTNQTVSVRDYPPQEICVTQMNGWRYALFPHAYEQFTMMHIEQLFVIGVGADMKMYVVDGMQMSTIAIPTPGTDTLVYRGCCNINHIGPVIVYQHFLKSIERTSEGYRLVKSYQVLKYSDGTPVDASGGAASENGRWLALETNKGVLEMSLDTLKPLLVSPDLTGYGLGYLDSQMELAISNDGSTIFLGGRQYAGRQFSVVGVNDECGSYEPPGGSGNFDWCSEKNLGYLFDNGDVPEGYPVTMRFDASGKRLDFFVVNAQTYHFTRAALYAFDTKPELLHYLALGDSFASGEGDSGHYAPHTDNAATPHTPEERCHLGDRAYPFVLAHMGLDIFTTVHGTPVRSVACKGARINDVASNVGFYQGQNDRLKGLSPGDEDQAILDAMNMFIPGRVRQIDFVDEYQPRSLTLQIGGNDIQFAPILTACAHSLVTCSYAAGPTDRRNVGESIKALYPSLTALYTRLAAEDPGARIFVSGYPMLTNDTVATCPLRVNLDRAEREMVNQGVRYINKIVRAAALSAGVGYLDIEDALAGHQLCDDAPYVNGINFGNLESQETYHPNAAGHQAIADTIVRQLGTADLAAAAYCPVAYPCPVHTDPPSLPSYFGDSSVRPTYIAVPSELVNIVDTAFPALVVQGIQFLVQTTLLAAGSTVHIELHSMSLDLGTATVSVDGLLSVSLKLPDTVESGYHTIHVYGTSPSGEAVDLYQLIYVGPTGDFEVTPAVGGENAGNGSVASATGNIPTTTVAQVSAASPLTDVLNTIMELPQTGDVRGRLLTLAGIIVTGLLLLLLALTLWRERRH